MTPTPDVPITEEDRKAAVAAATAWNGEIYDLDDLKACIARAFANRARDAREAERAACEEVCRQQLPAGDWGWGGSIRKGMLDGVTNCIDAIVARTDTDAIARRKG